MQRFLGGEQNVNVQVSQHRFFGFRLRLQAIALAGGWENGGNLRHIIVFRRADDWRLMATKIDIRGSLYGKRPIPTDNIWLRDSDVVLVTKQPIKTVADGIDLIFTQGIYAALPILADSNLFIDGNNN